MQPSLIQLKTILLRGVNVWPRPFNAEEDQQNYNAQGFDFDGVSIMESAQLIDPPIDDPYLYELVLRVSVRNEEGKKAPYFIDMEVYGAFEIAKNLEIPDNKEDVVLVNGCAILYGAIREQVHALSSRSIYGPLILPTVNFLDKRQKNKSNPIVTEKKQKKRTSKKDF